MGRKEEKAGEKGSGEEEEEDEEGVTASAFGLHHFRRLSAGGPVPPQTCLRRNCNKLGDGNGVIGAAATAGNAVPTASGAVRAAGKEFSNEGTIVSERGMYPVVHILEGLFVLLLVILFAVFVDNGNDDYIFVLSVVRYIFVLYVL